MKAGISLVILGFGGHARSVGNVALAAGVAALLFLDPLVREGESFAGFKAVSAFPQDLPGEWSAIPAVGDNSRRAQQCAETPVPLATLVAPTALLGVGVTIGPGTFLAHHAHVGPLAWVGIGAIINTGAIVEHDCVVGDYTHVSVNATIAGGCQIGKRVMVGAGAVIIDGMSVCDDVMIGAGAVVAGDIDEPGTYVGVPARRIR